MRTHSKHILHRTLGLALLVAGLQLAGANLRAEDAKADSKAILNGVWEQSHVEHGGVKKKMAESERKEKRATVTFKDGAASFRIEQEPEEGKTKIDVIEMKYVVDTTKTPHQIDLILAADGKEKRTLGIFKRDQQDLVIALDSHDNRGQRPKDFTTKKGDGFDVITLTPTKEEIILKPTKVEPKE